MKYDYVKCCNCETVQTVPCGEEICPVCGVTGTLAWVENAPQEVDAPIGG